MAKLYNLARMSTATTGTGTITLGSAVPGYLTFAGAGATNGETIAYAIADGSNSEIGTGVYTSSGTTLTRTVTKSTNSDAAISLSGTAEVFITPRREDLASLGEPNAFTGATQTFSLGGTSSLKLASTSNYNVVTMNNNSTLANVLGMFGGASGDANTNYVAAPTAIAMWIAGSTICSVTAGGISPSTDGGTYFGLSSLRWAGGVFKPFTVATLPGGPTQGQLAYASNLRVWNGAASKQGAAAGTGGFVQYNGTAWKNFDAQSDTAVA